MDKLTIEQKAQRYDEAIEVAKRKLCFDNAGMIDNFTPDDIREIFPELKKPEDEEIRKGLIENFKWFCGDYPETAKWGKADNLLVKDILAWLEKQKTSEETIISQHEDKICKENNDSLTSEDARIKKYLLSMFPDPNDSWDGISAREIIAWLEKQGQTFTKKDVDDAWLKGMCDAKHELEKQCGQNSTWSEEDEKMVNNILTPLAGRFPWNIYQPMYDWLKALKGRVQPKQRWSEEDASRLEEVMCMIEANGRWVRSDDAVKSVLDWLKSLQQRIGE